MADQMAELLKAHQSLVDRAGKFDKETASLLLKADAERKALVKQRADERTKMMADKLAASIALEKANEGKPVEPVPAEPAPVAPAPVAPVAHAPAVHTAHKPVSRPHSERAFEDKDAK